MDEVINLIDSPNVLLCKFDKKFLSVPKEILTLTMAVSYTHLTLPTKA